MERKERKMQAIKAPQLIDLINYLNEHRVKRDNMVSIFQNSEKDYVATFYI